jgi:DNA-directed RNA polymerase specialized sigma24 family protein
MGKDTKCCNLSAISVRFEQFISSAEESFINTESEHILENNLKIARESLTSRQQEILYLKYNLGYSNDLICEIMDIKYQSVRNLLSEAIRALRIKMDS